MRKKEFLIPKEKKKRIIYLDRRGGREVGKNVWAAFFGVLSFLSVLYCAVIGVFMSYGTKFFLVWLFLGLVFGLLAWLMQKPAMLKRIPGWAKSIFVALCLAGIILLAVVEGLIVGQFHAKPTNGADYCVILGAQWKEDGPSYVLKKRLDSALEYLDANPETKVVVTGGMGANEPMSEGEGMKQYLVDAGIDNGRILVENQSLNTYQNLVNTKEMIDAEGNRVVLVTSNFHMFRAYMMAKKLGYANLEGLAAGSYPSMLPNNMFREFLGILKDAWMGRIL